MNQNRNYVESTKRKLLQVTKETAFDTNNNSIRVEEANKTFADEYG